MANLMKSPLFKAANDAVSIGSSKTILFFPQLTGVCFNTCTWRLIGVITLSN